MRATQPTLRETFLFFALIVVANALFVTLIARELLPQGLYNLGRFFLLGGVLAGTVFAFRGFPALVDLVKPLTKWRIHPAWFLLAASWAAGLSLATWLAKGTFMEAGDISTWLFRNPQVWPSLLIGALIGEIVWVGYAIRSLAPRFGVLSASLITGVAWTGWWTPIALYNIGVISDLPIPALFLNMLGVAAMCGFIYAHTKSGIAVLLLQLGVNSSALIFPVMAASGGVPTYWAFGAIYLAATLILYALFPPERPTPVPA